MLIHLEKKQNKTDNRYVQHHTAIWHQHPAPLIVFIRWNVQFLIYGGMEEDINPTKWNYCQIPLLNANEFYLKHKQLWAVGLVWELVL